ncbi:glycosyltransferase family 2 protein [Sphingomonas melonis]
MIARSSSPTIAVVVATRGRAAEVCILLEQLAQGHRRPDHVVIVGSSPADWAGTEAAALPIITLASSEPGLPRQRNAGVRHLLENAVAADVIVFFDDDFRPHRDWLGSAAAVFETHEDVVGLTGTVLRDGAKTAAIDEAEASNVLDAWVRPVGEAAQSVPRLYGCNMAVRAAVFDRARFDERLPLYGWLEDLDFSGQLQGRQVLARHCAGVHLGSKGARVSGRRYGYSQIANPLYLARKGTCPPLLAARFLAQALILNGLRAFHRHPLFDYRGRLDGNLRALGDVLRGRMRPERILDL